MPILAISITKAILASTGKANQKAVLHLQEKYTIQLIGRSSTRTSVFVALALADTVDSLIAHRMFLQQVYSCMPSRSAKAIASSQLS